MWDGNKKVPDSRLYSVEEILATCLQDKPFYEESGGGVTLSGGEVLTQPKLAAALLRSLREKGIHTALETSGYAPADIFNEVSALADLVLFDIKHYDDSRHVEGTGVHNDLILANLKTAIKNKSSKKIPVLLRLAVIPGYNDSEEDANGFASLFNSFGIESVQLLPFHQFGERKYRMLNLPYAMLGIPQLHEEDIEGFTRTLTAAGINCVI